MSIEDSGQRSQVGSDDSSSKESRIIGTPSTFEITIDGKKLTNELYKITLRQPIQDHHELRVVVHNINVSIAEDNLGDISEFSGMLGKSISLSVKHQDNSEVASLSFVGLVTNIEFNNGIGEFNHIDIIAKSPTVMMDAVKNNAFFYDQKSSDIISTTARNHSITLGTVDATSTTMKFCAQYRETDFDFIWRLASSAGMFAFYDGEKFHVTKKGGSDSVTLGLFQELGNFSANLGTVANQFNATNYSYNDDKPQSSKSKSISISSTISQISNDASKDLYTKPSYFEEDNEVTDQKSLDDRVGVALGRSLGRMITCTGESIGIGMKVGHRVRIENAGDFNGEYLLLSVKHVIEEGQYYNKFTCTPLDVAHSQLKSRRKNASVIQSAKVTNIDDPDQLGRIKVKFPWNEGEESVWLRVVKPDAGSERGWYSVPEVEDEVLVGYEEGSPDRPVILGSLYNGKNKPPCDGQGADNTLKGFYTRTGHKIEFSDEDGKESISIIDKDGSQIVFDTAEKTITVKSETGVTVESTDISIKASGNLVLEGNAVEINASGGDIKAEAAMNMNLKAGIQQNVEGNMTNIKGSLIKLN